MRERKDIKRSWLANSLIAVWLLFTISLTIWWYIFSQEQMTKLSAANLSEADEILRNQQMLFWEGGTLIVSLLVGAIALTYLVWRDKRRTEQVMNFFMNFTHELKTPLATVRLYAETLREQLGPETSTRELSSSLMTEIDRLSLQLDNSLAFAQLDDQHRLHVEPLSLNEVLRPLKEEFSPLQIHSDTDSVFTADSQAISIIFRNLFKNALQHGKASSLSITSNTEEDSNSVTISIHDDGKGLQGEREHLAKRFSRLYHGSGSGIGLFLSSQLAEKMGGSLTFPSNQDGFAVELKLPREVPA